MNEPVQARCDYVGCTEHPTRIFSMQHVWPFASSGAFVSAGTQRLMLCGKHHGDWVESLRKEIEGELLTLDEVPC